jgi:hypothetical protein
MEQEHNAQRWTYIMDFWQELKANTKIWVTKGRTPGSDVFIKIGSHLPRKLPRGCEFPKPPKPPTKCQTSYQLGAQLSQTIGDMVIKDEQKKADIKRLELVQKYQSPDASEDEGNLGEDGIMRLPGTGSGNAPTPGKVVYYEQADGSMSVIPTGVQTPSWVTLTAFTANVRCAGGSEIQQATLRELDTTMYTHDEWVTACQPGGDHHNLWDPATNDCRRETYLRAIVSGKAFVIDASALVIAIFPRPAYVTECRMPKIRPGWPDISKRAYDGQWQSEVCSTLYGNRGGSGVGKHCGPFSGRG